MSGRSKLRVLCLHGYGQSGPTFRAKSGAARSESKKLAEFVFAQAPHELSPDELAARREITGRPAIGSASDPCQEPARCWWRHDPADPSVALQSVEQSVLALGELCAREGPFDGVCGFSQGASLVGLLAARQLQGELPVQFGFFAMFSGFVPRTPQLATCVEAAAPLSVPSFHCYGASDEIIASSDSIAAATLFDETSRVIVEHPGGHLVPSDKEVRRAFKLFLQHQQANLLLRHVLNEWCPSTV